MTSRIKKNESQHPRRMTPKASVCPVLRPFRFAYHSSTTSSKNEVLWDLREQSSLKMNVVALRNERE